MYLETFNETSEDFMYFEFHFDDGESIAYVIANATEEYESWLDEGTNIIFLQDTIVTGEWMNFQRDLVHDYEAMVGSLPDTSLVEVYLVGLANKNSKLVAYLDDLYIYYDPAPAISLVGHSTPNPVSPQDHGPVMISARVIDSTLESVVLNYREDSGSWITLTMNQTAATYFNVNLTDLVTGVFVEYYVTGTDAFGKSTDALDGTAYFSFTAFSGFTEPSILPIIAVAAFLVVGVVIVLYMFVFKKKE